MKEQITKILHKYIEKIVQSQPEYEYVCYERGLYPKSAYERIYNAFNNNEWIEGYLRKNGLDTSNFEQWYSIFREVRNTILTLEVSSDKI